ncbi:hypothetical protein Franean1_1118 [Parafrankia sp. EAN1pec]|nr:hypothetical protein Franean1_1118 [Frankia sp. EAN1pec]
MRLRSIDAERPARRRAPRVTVSCDQANTKSVHLWCARRVGHPMASDRDVADGQTGRAPVRRDTDIGAGSRASADRAGDSGSAGRPAGRCGGGGAGWS